MGGSKVQPFYKVLNFLRHTLWGATTEAKSVAYKCLVRPSGTLIPFLTGLFWNLSSAVQHAGFVVVAGSGVARPSLHALATNASKITVKHEVHN